VYGTPNAGRVWETIEQRAPFGHQVIMLIVSVDAAKSGLEPIQLTMANIPIDLRRKLPPFAVGYVPTFDSTDMSKAKATEAARLQLQGILAFVASCFNETLEARIGNLLVKLCFALYLVVADQVGKGGLLCMSKSPMSTLPCHCCLVPRASLSQARAFPARNPDTVAAAVQQARRLLGERKIGDADKLLKAQSISNAIPLGLDCFRLGVPALLAAPGDRLHNMDLGITRELKLIVVYLAKV
jgi:hypothetical protein